MMFGIYYQLILLNGDEDEEGGRQADKHLTG